MEGRPICVLREENTRRGERCGMGGEKNNCDQL